MESEYNDFRDVCSQKSEVATFSKSWGLHGKADIIGYDWMNTGLEPDFTALDLILEVYWPTINLLEYNRLLRKLVQFGTYIDFSYDDDRRYRYYKFIYLTDLHTYISAYRGPPSV